MNTWLDNSQMDIETFYRRFRHKPKVRNIEQIHALWLRANERAIQRRKDLHVCINYLVKEISPNNKGEHVIYYYDNVREGEILCRKFSKDSSDDKYYYSRYDVLELKKRSDVLTFILANDKAFEIGDMFNKLDKLCSYRHLRVWQILTERIYEKLREHYKKLNIIPEDVFTIEISGIKYYVNTIEKHNTHGWFKFEMRNICAENDNIKIS
jgi:hypothetical protein